MAQVPTAIPMSPSGETPNAPLAAETHLKISDSAPAVDNNPVDTPAPKDETQSDPKPETNIPVEMKLELEPKAGTESNPESGTPAQKNQSPSSAAEGDTSAKRKGVIVHHLNNSRSQRLLWLLEELEIPYEIQKYQRNSEMRAPQTLKKVHPLGKSPIITDGDVTLAESGAITEYLITKYGEKFRPTESGKIDDLYFTHYVEGSLMPLVVNKIIFTIVPQRSPALLRPLIKGVFTNLQKRLLEPEIKAHCEMIESHLAKSKTGWLAGGDHPTSADFMMVFAAESLVAKTGSFVGPKLREYVKRAQERPAYKRGIEKGGKDDNAKL